MHRALRIALPALALAALAVVHDSDAQVTTTDPAARGLDVFVHAPTEVAPGGTLPVALEAVGFTSVVTPARLPRATVEATWNPETLGTAAKAPPSVKAITDAEGRAHLDVPMPD